MADSFAKRVLGAMFSGPHSLGAVYAAPGEALADGSALRVIVAQGEEGDAVSGFVSKIALPRTVIEIRAGDPALEGGEPAEGGSIKIDDDAPEFAGAVFEIEGKPLRLDSARLVWTCYVAEVEA